MDKLTPAEAARSFFVSGEGEALKAKEEKEKSEKDQALQDDQNIQLLQISSLKETPLIAAQVGATSNLSSNVLL